MHLLFIGSEGIGSNGAVVREEVLHNGAGANEGKAMGAML